MNGPFKHAPTRAMTFAEIRNTLRFPGIEPRYDIMAMHRDNRFALYDARAAARSGGEYLDLDEDDMDEYREHIEVACVHFSDAVHAGVLL